MTINDIARMAGVSSAAVSRYFNKGYISEEKREAIRQVVEQTGYRPSLQAQTLRTRKTRTIGVILPRVNNGAVGTMVDGILPVLYERGYQLILADTQNKPERIVEYLKMFNEKQADGMIYMGTIYSGEVRQRLQQTSVPLVIIGQRLENCRCVYHDEYHAMYDMTKLMFGKGRRKIGYLSAFIADEATGLERYRGYCAAVRNLGAAHLEKNMEEADFSLDAGYQAAERLWEKTGGLDGIICASDKIAVGAMRYLRKIGKHIPEDVMVSGHGDSGYSMVTTPPLSTIHYSYKEAGSLAAHMIMDILEKKESALEGMMLGYSICDRGSTGGTEEA
jgi:LacI family sucrose operon transcriptional repressor